MLRPVTFASGVEGRDVPERVSVHVKVDRDVWERFQSFVIETHGQKYGNLGREAENALKEYMDRDRFARVEDRLDDIDARLADIADAHAHTRTETVEKAERIADELDATDRTVIPADDVRRAIEDVAGADDRTVRKYQDLLKRRGLAYEHPTDGVWTCDRDTWLKWAIRRVNNNPTVTRMDVIEGYPIRYDEIEELAPEVIDA